MNNKSVYILSLDQLIKSDPNKSFNEFVAIAQKELGCYNIFAKAWVYSAFLVDSYFYKTIDSYNQGYLGSKNFTTKLTNQLMLDISNEQFKFAWNAMNKISPSEKSNILKIFNSNATIIFASVTNSMHHSYAKKQLDELFQRYNLPSFDENPNIISATSYQLHTLSRTELINKAITSHDLNQENLNLYSILNEVNDSSINSGSAKFRSISEQDFSNCLTKSNFVGEVAFGEE